MVVAGKRSSAWLGGDIDEAARDEAQTLSARIVVAASSAVVLAVNLGVVLGEAWIGLYLATELYVSLTSRGQVRGEAGSAAQRANFLVVQILATGLWSALAAMFWRSNRHELQIVAILLLTGQLFHAQAFAFRSRAILAITAGIPATALVVLPLAFGRFAGGALVAVMFSIALILAYVAISARANMKAALALRASYAEIERLAYFDPLTGLPNRRMFDNDFKRLMGSWEKRRTRFALLLVDLDGLKRVNDSMGHEAGDALLVETATTLRRLIRAGDSLARLGGDEFAILMANIDDTREVEAFCRRILDAFPAGRTFRGCSVRHTLCVGVAIYPSDGTDQRMIYKAADLALYAAKSGGGNQWRGFEPAMTT